MTISAFNAYRSYAWGAPEFKPIALETFNNMYGHGRNMGTFPGLTIVDAMDTLWIMSMMDEWEEGKQWIVTNLHVADLDQMLRVKEILLGYLGGLLSAYALSGDQDLLHKSIEVMEALKPAFNKDTGLLAYRYNPKVKFSTAKVDNTVQRVRLRVVNGKVVNTTEPASVDQVATVTSAPVPIVERDNANSIGLVGFQQPELIYFANLTGDSLIEEQLVKSRAVMSSIDRPKGLWMSYLNAATGKSNFTGTGLFDETTDFFYNMIRSYVQLNRQDAQLLKMYTDAIDNIQKMQLLKNIGNQLFARKFETKALLHTNNMDDTSCLLGGMLALGARELQKANSPKFHLHWQLAVNITDTCYQAANRTKTKLLPHSFTLNNSISTEGWMA
ncbi:PREDICTED: mannosyl-oligosaccharide 1,2-alpha-mannosidase IA-like, partial [Rhagoletis zephyria]|uniref:mannosyl-oligosaccharide 1,2-alpha-mannosidase IA-like n=1 Tax=Rhagoletis zephyria TaxID=28612 RepID=UPI000811671E